MPVTMYPGSIKTTCMPKRIKLETKRVAHGFESEFAAAVRALRGSGHEPGNRAHHHDAAAAAFAHMGNDGLRHAQDAKEIRFELAAPIVEAQVFDGGGEVDTGIVDEEIDGASFCVDCRSRHVGRRHRRKHPVPEFQAADSSR